jgi:uncharacterized membrane protein
MVMSIVVVIASISMRLIIGVATACVVSWVTALIQTILIGIVISVVIILIAAVAVGIVVTVPLMSRQWCIRIIIGGKGI